jgi:hypothetical protein
VKIECKPKAGVNRSYDTLTGSPQPEVGTSLLTYDASVDELAQTLGGEAAVTGEEKHTAPKKAKITAATP